MNKEAEQWKHEYEVLDACLELAQGKIAELKAENDRLREDYIKQSQQKDLDNARWQKRCTDLHIEDKAKADKYWLVLQEIKAIVCGNYEIIDTQGRKDIIKLITKAEEE